MQTDSVGLGRSLDFCISVSPLVIPLVTFSQPHFAQQGSKDPSPLGSLGILVTWRFLSLEPCLRNQTVRGQGPESAW